MMPDRRERTTFERLGSWAALAWMIVFVPAAVVEGADPPAAPPSKPAAEASKEEPGSAAQPVEKAAEAVGEATEKAAEAVGEATEKAAEVAKEATEKAVDTTTKAVFSFGGDVKDFPSRLWADVRGMAAPSNLGILAVSGGLAAASNEFWDDDVREAVADDPRRFGGTFNHFLDNSGESYLQLGWVAMLYGASLFLQHPAVHEFSLDAIHALTIEIPVVMGLKEGFDTRRPNGQRKGFPSGHVASTFTLAAVIHENFGLAAGIAGYLWGGFVAAHRMDTAKHDLSDVLFGAGLGTVIGLSAARNGSTRVGDVAVQPFVDAPSGARGLRLELRW